MVTDGIFPVSSNNNKTQETLALLLEETELDTMIRRLSTGSVVARAQRVATGMIAAIWTVMVVATILMTLKEEDTGITHLAQRMATMTIIVAMIGGNGRLAMTTTCAWIGSGVPLETAAEAPGAARDRDYRRESDLDLNDDHRGRLRQKET
mmetsp:Transcript_6208/g.17512  ORF Transcript_6208/g.17512 Transcript_6208/m.17512 type:complete len:151 (+) Transcript_6208:2858-3310(+)